MRPRAWNGAGSNWPSAMPATMQRNTHSVSQRSNRLMGACAAALAVTSHWADMVDQGVAVFLRRAFAGGQGLPPQQFSVRKPTMPFMASKSAE
jgi:hypothetical protein